MQTFNDSEPEQRYRSGGVPREGEWPAPGGGSPSPTQVERPPVAGRGPRVGSRVRGGFRVQAAARARAFRIGYRRWRRSFHAAVRSPGAWSLAVIVVLVVATVPAAALVAGAVGDAAVVAASTSGEGAQDLLSRVEWFPGREVVLGAPPWVLSLLIPVVLLVLAAWRPKEAAVSRPSRSVGGWR